MFTPLIFMLLLVNVLVLIISAFRLKTRLVFAWLTALILIALLHLLIDGFYQSLFLVYIITAILILNGLWQLVRKGKREKRFLVTTWKVLWRLALVICLGLSLVLYWSFDKSDTFFNSLTMNSNKDLSQMSWSDAFQGMHNHLQQDYAFGEWKAINWDSLYTHYTPIIKNAEQSSDTAAYYLALRQYIFSIPDGHVSLMGNDFEQRKRAIQGGFGFAVIRMDDGRTIVHILDEKSQAAKSGMQWGAQILTWNGQPIDAAINEVSTLWASSPQATRKSQNIWQQNLLTRAAIGDSLQFTFQNPDAPEIHQANLVAYADSAQTLKQSLLMGLPEITFDLSLKPVTWEVLPDGYGYIKIIMEIPSMGGLNPVGSVKKAIAAFDKANVPGVIIDVRQNFGGLDEMTPRMMANFLDQPFFYEHISMNNPKIGESEIVGQITLQPSPTPYTGPVVLLVSNMTISTGEGFALIMQKRQRGPVMGFYSTAGAFGMAGSTIQLPADYTVQYPNGASLDESGVIQVDANHKLQGGITPDVRIPITRETMHAIFVEKRDVLMEQAVQNLAEQTN